VTTFALVHGAWHGAWCWERLTPLLQEAGHDVVAMDLPSEDGAATFDTYADVVCAALDGHDVDVVLVGHSYNGNTIPLVAARRPVRHLVYLCALVPDIGRSVFDQMSDELKMLNPVAYEQGLSVPDEQLRQVWTDLDLACAMFYGDCDEPTTKAAIDRLRPQSAYPAILPSSLTEFPAVPTTYVVCSEDQILRPEWSRHIARQRLGADPIELPGDHSPFYSRPSVLADLLLGLA
jgi:pimeloyl-ACP methyl ester carboxylesterase